MVHIAQQSRHPRGAQLDGAAAQARVALEDTVEGQAGQKALGRMMQHGKVLGPQVLAAAQPVLGHGAAVVVEGLGQQLAAADVEDERHARLGQTGPHRFDVDVRRREVTGGVGRDPHRRDAFGERLVQRVGGREPGPAKAGSPLR